MTEQIIDFQKIVKRFELKRFGWEPIAFSPNCPEKDHTKDILNPTLAEPGYPWINPPKQNYRIIS